MTVKELSASESEGLVFCLILPCTGSRRGSCGSCDQCPTISRCNLGLFCARDCRAELTERGVMPKPSIHALASSLMKLPKPCQRLHSAPPARARHEPAASGGYPGVLRRTKDQRHSLPGHCTGRFGFPERFQPNKQAVRTSSQSWWLVFSPVLSARHHARFFFFTEFLGGR